MKCKICNRWFKNKRAYTTHHSRMHRNTKNQEDVNTSFDFNEIKTFITSEIEKALKELNFSKPAINNDNTKDIGIVPIKTAKKMPKFNPLEVDKRMVIKDLKECLAEGIKSILKPMGSFDTQINFLEVPVEILA